jgi:hypothetical protein
MRLAFFLALLFGFAFNPAIADWKRVGGNATGTTYVDPTTLSKSESVVRMWILNDFKIPMKEENSKPYSSMKRHQEYDCKARRLRSLAITIHSGNMGQGSPIFSGADDMQWVPVIAGSIREATWKYACGF